MFSLSLVTGPASLVNAVDEEGWTALHDSCYHNHIDCARYLLQHGADMHILEPIDEAHTLYEEDKGIVFLARELMARLQKLSLGSQRAFRRPRVAGQISRSH